MKVLIVGAGPCGLVSLKEMMAQGFEAECVERLSYIGGVFGTAKAACYDGLYLTTSNVLMSYSDFPIKGNTLRYSRKDEYAQYLVEYVEHFKLLPHIKLNTSLGEAVWDASAKKWKVKMTTAGSAEVSKEFDALICATGANSLKKMPLVEAFAKYEGTVLHSSDYQNADNFKGKRVLVVGSGESAADISTEIAGVAAATTVWVRREVAYAPRFPDAGLADPNHDEYQTLAGTQAEMTIPDFLEMMTTARMATTQTVAQYGLSRQFLWGMIHKFLRTNDQMSELARASRMATATSDWSTYQKADQALWVTKNSRMCREVALGKIKYLVTPAIAKTEGTVVEFDNGDKVDVDVVICCTGYKIEFAWLKTDVGGRCPRMWFKHAIPACFNEIPIAFVGYSRPHQGGIPQTGEMVARYVGMLLAGQKRLPADFAAQIPVEAKAEEDYYVLSPHLKSLVDYPSFMEALARLMGVEPAVPWTEPALFFKYCFYPLWPAWYRMRGPGANKEAAMEVFDKFPILKCWKPTPIFFLTLFNYSVAKVLSFLFFFVPFAPRTGVDKRGLYLWARPKNFVLHGNKMRFSDLFKP